MTGIYCWHNQVNGKRYIGQSGDVTGRKHGHLSRLRAGTHVNRHLQAAFLQYGEDNFSFLVLEEVSMEMLDAREKAWICYYRSAEREHGYNLDLGGSVLRNPSPETRQRMSESMRGKNVGKERSAETRRVLSEAAKRRPRRSVALGLPPISEETRRKIAETLRGRRATEAARSAMRAAQSVRAPASEETNRKISESLRGHPVSEETRAKLRAANLGKKRRRASA